MPRKTVTKQETTPIAYEYYDGLIPKGCVTIIAGQGESGKSTLMCYLADGIGRNVKTLIVSNEEDSNIIAGRLDMASTAEICSHSDETPPRKITKQELLEFIDSYDVVFVDSLITFNDRKDINRAGTAEAFLYPIVQRVAGSQKAVVFLHHTNKGGGDTLQDIVSGSERLVSGVRHCKIVINDRLNNRRFLAIAKDNTGAPRRNYEIIANEREFQNGGKTWVINKLVVTTEDMDKITYLNSREAKRKQWDKEMYRKDSRQVDISPPEIIQVALIESNGEPIDREFIDEKTGRYSNWTYSLKTTGDKWVTKTKKGTKVTYHFTDLALEWLENQ